MNKKGTSYEQGKTLKIRQLTDLSTILTSYHHSLYIYPNRNKK